MLEYQYFQFQQLQGRGGNGLLGTKMPTVMNTGPVNINIPYEIASKQAFSMKKRPPSSIRQKQRTSTNFRTAQNSPYQSRSELKTPKSRENTARAHVTMVQPIIEPPIFAQKRIQSLNEIEQRALTSAKKRPQSAVKIKHKGHQSAMTMAPSPEQITPRLEESLDQQEIYQNYDRSLSNVSPLKRKFQDPFKQQTSFLATPHRTKIGFQLPLLQVTKTTNLKMPPQIKQNDNFTQLPSVKMIPSAELMEGNQQRVDWMKNFFTNVYTSAHPEAASLEAKIERLQRKLGGQPIPIEQNLSQIGDKNFKEKEEKMMKEIQQARQKQFGDAPKSNLDDPELLARFKEEQEKIAAAKKAAIERAKKEKEDAIAKQQAEQEKVRKDEERARKEVEKKRLEEERKKLEVVRIEREKKEAEQRAQVMKQVQDRITKAIEGPKNEEDDPFSMLKKKKKPRIKVEEDAGSGEKKDTDGDGNSSARKSKKGKKKKGPGGINIKPISSTKQLGLVDDGTVPKELVKGNNEAVDLLKQADDKLQRILEMYVPSRSNSSNKSNATSRRSQSTSKTVRISVKSAAGSSKGNVSQGQNLNANKGVSETKQSKGAKILEKNEGDDNTSFKDYQV